jgi:predicted ATPase
VTTRIFQGIDLNDDTSSGHEDKGNQNRPQKRSLRHISSSSSTTAGDMISTRITDLEGRAPRSVCTLVKNLLDCSKGDFCGSDTYSSFADLRQDLKLMVEDPTCYLNDIQVSKSLPTLEICDKLYGREVEETKLDGFYQQYISEKTSRGVTISGGAGAGKSRLALHALKLTSESNGLFSAAKFEQNQLNSKPLQAVGELFNALCDVFVEGVTPNDLLLVEYELQASLGNQAGLLMGVVPNLMKLMPSYRIGFEAPSNCMNAAASIGYLFGELLRVITSHSKRPISLFLDDIQFADNESLLLIGQLLFIAKSITPSVFFLFCHRDDEASLSPPFGLWLNHTITTFSLKSIELGDMSVDSVNSLVSETLHLSPRITRPLSAVLHHKSRGNPLFLTQLLGSLQGQGYIYFDLGQCKWSWDMDKIVEEPVASSVVVLLMKEMKRLPPNLQLGLGVASCLGSFIQKDVLDILSKDLNVDLIDILNQVSKKGFMDNLDDGATFRFAHDKIQEAGMS